MFRKIFGTVVGLALLGPVTAGPCVAITYQYQGPNFSGASGVYDTSMNISGMLTFDMALEPNVTAFFTHTDTTGTATTLQSFNFFDGVNTITEQNATAYGIRIFTDSIGLILNWRVDLQKFHRDNDLLPDNVMMITCTVGGGICGEYSSTGAAVDDYNGAVGWFTDLGIATGSTGDWNVVPIPAALPLFATALAGIGLVGWRRRKQII